MVSWTSVVAVSFFPEEPPAKQAEGPWQSAGAPCRRSARTAHGHVKVLAAPRRCTRNPDSPEEPQLLPFSLQKLTGFSPKDALQQCFEEQSEFPPQGGTVKLSQRAIPKPRSVTLISVRESAGDMFLHQNILLRDAGSLKISLQHIVLQECKCEGSSLLFSGLPPPLQLVKDPLLLDMCSTQITLEPQQHERKRWK